MIRTKQSKKVSAILTADWHLRESIPICRTDNFWKAQWQKVDEISELQKKYDCPVIHSGDLFDYWKASPYLLSKTIKHLPKQFLTIYGNHDLPAHNLEDANKSGIYTLFQAGKLEILQTCHWGKTPDHEDPASHYVNLDEGKNDEYCYEDAEGDYINPFEGMDDNIKSVLVWHTDVYQGKKPWPGCTYPPAGKLLRKYPEYDLIVTGHNHKSFVETFEDRVLVNPGSLTRQTAAQINHKPKVYLWYAEDNTVEEYILQFDKDVINRKHLEKIEERDSRIDAFISKLDKDWEMDVSFINNLDKFADKNPDCDEAIKLIHKAMEVDVK
jgi:DNA repair exonuclease SbcCD nuclease subunit